MTDSALGDVRWRVRYLGAEPIGGTENYNNPAAAEARIEELLEKWGSRISIEYTEVTVLRRIRWRD